MEGALLAPASTRYRHTSHSMSSSEVGNKKSVRDSIAGLATAN
jgi:hypothetical protein